MKLKRKIFFITNNYFPYKGGVARSIKTWQAILANVGYEVFIVTFDFSANNQALRDEKNVFRVPSFINFNYKNNPMAISYRAAAFIENLIQEIEPDIIHVHHPFLLGVIGKKLARKYKLPIVFTYHTQYEQYVHYAPLPAFITKKLVLHRVNNFCAEVDHIIAPSHTIKQILHKRGAETPIAVIPTPINATFFHSSNKQFSDICNLLTVSRFVQEKNIPFLLHAFNNLHNKHNYILRLVGYGCYKEFLHHYAYEQLKLSTDQVVFVEDPAQAELINLYKNAHIFLFASTTETQGLVLAEAMASGTPVIAVTAPGSCDIIENGNNGYLVCSEQEMAKRIENLYSDKKLYSKLSHNAFATAQNFSTDTLALQLIKVYEDLFK